MKKLFITLSILSFLNVNAQVDSVLFGLTTGALGSGSHITLARMNTTIGMVSGAANSSTYSNIVGVQIGNSTIDTYNKVFYFLRGGSGPSEIVGISLYNGSVVSSNTLSFSNGAYLHNMYYNCGDTTIYVLVRTATTPTSGASNLYLAKVDPGTGVVTNISQNSIGNSVMLNNVTIDPYNKIYYYFTPNTIVGLDITTGAIVSNATMTCPGSNLNYLYNGVFYNRGDSTLYGLARTVSPSGIYLAKFSPNGIVSVISQTSVASSFVVANSDINPYQNVYYLINGNGEIINISLSNGMVVANPTINNTVGNNFVEMHYNCKLCPEPKKAIVTSIRTNNNNDQVIYPNPVSGTLYIELKQPGNYELELSDISGRKVLSKRVVESNKAELNLYNFEKGVYVLNINSGNKLISTQRILIAE